MRTDVAENWKMPFDKLWAGFRDAALPRGSLSHEVRGAPRFGSLSLGVVIPCP
jgi:hypothetical protein